MTIIYLGLTAFLIGLNMAPTYARVGNLMELSNLNDAAQPFEKFRVSKVHGNNGNGAPDAFRLQYSELTQYALQPKIRPDDDTAARTHNQVPGYTVNITDFGARCDGVTDDAASINAAFAYVRSSNRVVGGQRSAKIVFPQGNCIARSSLNWTGLTTRAITIDGGGAIITSKAVDKAAIDMMGSRFLRIRDLYILGDQRNMPKIGIQLGRIGDTSNNSADGHSFENVFIDGYFSLASIYNLNAETTKFDHVFAWNKASGAFSLIQDGLNHFGVTSDFATLAQPVDKSQSFNENLFLNCDFRNSGGGTPIWTAQTARHRYIASYVANTSGPVGMELYSLSSGDANAHLDIDMHFETSELKDVFLLSGTNSSPKLIGFKYRDHHPFATNSIFKLGNGVASASLVGADIEIGATSTAKLFDVPTLWMITGQVLLAQPRMWNAISESVGGIVDLNGKVSFYGQFFNSPIRLALSGAAASIPSNASVVRLTHVGTVLSQTINMPEAVVDGQTIQFVSYSGTVKALTFTPAINGWKNGAVYGPNLGMRARWDANSGAWYREQ